jgi:hypothetical protein
MIAKRVFPIIYLLYFISTAILESSGLIEFVVKFLYAKG